ncbi:uncharacterized protein LOC121736818 isoform X2 [Aricia agestis]|uniref:uncharacterized protein LOC121736818 isoform X2 n=1 Tax=Aricia agestis TaxID=91739 RepID=UPI001C20394B|nr:uncharacterized protein LOC121736818 isoform X2 [Aricia agestis]
MDIDDDSSEPPPPGTGSLTPIVNQPSSPNPVKLPKGVENAKKRLRAFSIQKKTPITPLVPKTTGSGSVVVIGKLSSVKTTPKPDKPTVEPDVKKPPKPPKPGAARKALQDSYSDLQKRTLSEIEDMKRKMELVELGIPLGLICPTATSEKAMPTKAMPPIKSFLNKKNRAIPRGQRQYSSRRKYSSTEFRVCPEQLDEIIREAKKARAEGRQFKFDYQKLLPDYDNPFQKRKEEPQPQPQDRSERRKSDYGKDDERRRSDKYDHKKHSDYRSEDKHKRRHRDKDHDKEKERSKSDHKKTEEKENTEKETDVDLKDFLVCDSWSLDNDEKVPPPSPKIDEKHINKQLEPSEIHKASLDKTNEALKHCIKDSPKKVEKLQPVIDSFKFEIDPNEDDEVLDIFDENLDLNKYAKPRPPKLRDETSQRKTDIEVELYEKDMTDINEDTFLESVINEIKQENMSDDDCEKGLVEYDESPSKDSPETKRSATPDIVELGSTSQRSDYSGYASTDSYRTAGTSESGYKSVDSTSFRISPDKELNASLQDGLSRPTVDSLETWSFVLKICQPLLFRHDKNKCYKETHTTPKIWYTENPKQCTCVKDRAVVYEELEMCKMDLVDRVYGCDQIEDCPTALSRSWYPRCPLSPANSLPMSNEWEADDSQHRPDTPQRDDVLLDREYQRFMEAVECKVESSRSTTPVQQETKKKRKEDVPKEIEDKKLKKLEDWSQESDIEIEVEKTKKLKEKEKSKVRKRKHSSSTQSSLSESEDSKKKKNKALKKKALKKINSKSAKKRRIGKKILKKLKEQEKKKKKYKESDDEKDKKKDKKSKKKKLMKAKKKPSKKKKKIKIKSSSSSSSDSSDSDSESDSEKDKKKKAKKKSVDSKKKKSKKRKQSTSDSTQSEETFDVNILNNIKTERLTDDDFSPRRQKERDYQRQREIINVKELQNDFVGNNIQIKKEIIEQVTPEERDKQIDVDESSIADSVQSDTKEKECEKSNQKKNLEAELKSIPIPEEGKPAKERAIPEVKTPEAPTEVKLTDIALPEVKTDKSLPKVTQDRTVPEVKATPEDSSISQSSQDSVCSVKAPSYEKDDSYLRPSSQNSNYNFHDVIASHAEYKHDDVTVSREYKQDVTTSHEYKHDVTASHEYKHDVTTSQDTVSHEYKHEASQEYKHDVTVSQDYKHDVTASQEYKHDVTVRQEYKHDVTVNQEYKHDVTVSQEYKHDVTVSQEYKHDVTVNQEYKHDVSVSQDYKHDATPSHEYKHDEPDYEAGNYEMYEQLAMAYQSDVANQLSPCGGERPIETVVHARCGEIKCDWRPGDHAPVKSPRPSRWGLKPSEVNIVLTGGSEADESPQRVFQIQSLANRDHNEGYDEAYMDMYGAADRLQYGDCFSDGGAPPPQGGVPAPQGGVPAPQCGVPAPEGRVSAPRSSLDARIDQALSNSVLGEIAKDAEESQREADKTTTAGEAGRGMKRVSFADGYKPGQDSDVEEPPIKKRKKARRVGCAWPCPATHPDHVPLWDALPPPPPPPGSPPRARPLALQPHIIPGTQHMLPGSQHNITSTMLPGTQQHILPGTQQHILPGTPQHILPGTQQHNMIPGSQQHMIPGSQQHNMIPVSQQHMIPGSQHMLPGANAPHMLSRAPGLMPGPRMLPGPNQMMNMGHTIHAQFDPNTSLAGFLPPEPPPGMIALR